MKTNCPQCNKATESRYSEKEELHYFYCTDCKIGGKGKTTLGLQFIPQAGVYIGLIKGEKSNKSAMWSKDGVHIVRSTPNLNIAG